jgi:hypothetical protein
MLGDEEMSTVSERAQVGIKPPPGMVADIPERDRPLSEQFRIVAKKWVDADSAASILEETKTACLAQKMANLGEMPVNRAELTVKASAEWHDHLHKICEQRREANLLKMQLEYLRMKFQEWQSANATNRAEMRLGR